MDQRQGNRAPVNPNVGVSLHRQLFLVLHDEIDRGVLQAGDPLPTEQQLCEQFGVSRITVRRALADLADQGYIERKQGAGSFVRAHHPAEPSSGGGSYMDGLRRTQFETTAEVIEWGLLSPPRAVSLAINRSDDMLHVLRVRRERRTKEPLMVTEAWLPADLARALPKSRLKRTPLYELLSDAGIEVQRLEHALTAEIAGPRLADLLQVPIGSALMRINRVGVVDGHPHHFVSIVIASSRSRVLIDVSAEQLQQQAGLAIAHDVQGAAPPP